MASSNPEVSDTVSRRNQSLARTIWFVVLKTAKRTASFSAIIVIDEWVNNAKMNIKRVWKPRTMKWSLIDNENDNFLWRNARTTQLKL